jgi:hypothetical protein
MLKYYRQWYNFALVDIRRDIKLDDLILVTGCVLTRKWTTATYLSSTRTVNATLGAQVAPVAEFKFSLSAGWRTSSAITTRPAPTILHPFRTAKKRWPIINAFSFVVSASRIDS